MDFLTAKNVIRTEFYNSIAQMLTYDDVDSLDVEPTDAERAAITRLLDKLGRYYYDPTPCTSVVSTYYQNTLAELIKLDPSSIDYKTKFEELAKSDPPTQHDDCPCVRSEKHSTFHRCKHGYYSK